ncbi:MAG: LysM peptidoglycan-binding domain-containing protein [Rhodobacteraceae bacterium]|nr:LysM peptidoglycan-binding domain-containing protein [Paracoccaceae bacterium]
MATAALQSPVESAPVVPPAAPAKPGTPSFDLVRVEPGGEALVAGRAAAGSRVSVIVDGQTEGSAVSDEDGNFAVLFSLGASDRPRAMWLTAEMDQGEPLTSADRVIVGPDGQVPDGQVVGSATLAAAPQETDAVQASGTGGPPPREESADTTGVTMEASATEEGAGEVREAPQVLLSDAGGVRALDTPPLEAGALLRLDSVDYGAGEAVVLRGRAAPGAELQAYLDGNARGDVRAAGSGLWEFVLPAVSPGLYRLRIDRIGADGRVEGRVEVPFRREPPDVIRSAFAGPARVVTVQPGATLWAIARDRYGEGPRYVAVFEANRSQIRNPDLIYPGQVFDLPDLPSGE